MAKPTTIDEYAAQQLDWQAAVMRKLMRLVKKHAPQSVGDIKWSQPVFSAGGPMAYMKAEKGYVRFGFWRGAEIDDPAELLEGGGTKMRHIKIAEGEAIPKALAKMIAQAQALNEKHGDPTSRAALKRKPAKKKPAKKKPAKKKPAKKKPAKKKPAKKKPAKKKPAKKKPAKKKPAKKKPAKKKPAKKRTAKKAAKKRTVKKAAKKRTAKKRSTKKSAKKRTTKRKKPAKKK